MHPLAEMPGVLSSAKVTDSLLPALGRRVARAPEVVRSAVA